MEKRRELFKHLIFMSLLLVSFLSNTFAEKSDWQTTHAFPNTRSSEEVLVRTNFVDNQYLLLEYQLPKVRVSELPKKYENNTLSKVTLGGAPKPFSEGDPLIPIIPAKVIIPDGYMVNFEKIIVLKEGNQQIPGQFFIEYAEATFPLIPGVVPKKGMPNPSTYKKNELYPRNTHYIASVQKKHGVAIAYVNLHPVTYNPQTKALYSCDKISLTIPLRRVRSQSIPSVLPKVTRFNFKQMGADNPKELTSYFKRSQPTMEILGICNPADSYQYVVVTNSSIRDATTDVTIHDLIAHKQSRGLSATIVTIEDVYANYSGVDNAEKLRNFIIDAYNNWDTEFVLLGGDTNVLPYRLLTAEGTSIPSDLYFQCLDGSFNEDGDGIWGEPNDGPGGGDVDLTAEIYLGRASAENAVEMSNFVYKTLAYENQPESSPHLRNTLIVGEHLGSQFGPGEFSYARPLMEEIRFGSTAAGYSTVGFSSCPSFTIDTLYDFDGVWAKTDILSLINANSYGIINHLGHANTNYVMKFYNPDADVLTNDKYIFAYSQGCIPGDFASDCIAEHLTTSHRHGMFAVVFNSRYGWGAFNDSRTTLDAPSQRFNRQFWHGYFGEYIFNLGAINAYSHEQNIWDINGTHIRWCYYETNLQGDPQTILRGQVTGPSITYSSNSISDSIGGNRDGLINPDEEIDLMVKLVNVGSEAASGVSATLSTTDSYVSILDSLASFGSIPCCGAIKTGLDPCRFQIAPSCPTPHTITFTLTIVDDDTGSWSSEFTLSVYTSSQISGYVRALTGGNPLESASVAFSGPLSGTVQTDASGYYMFGGIDGTYSLVAQHNDFLTSDTLVVSIPPSITEVNFDLTRPIISATPGRLSDTLFVGDSSTSLLTISNSGDDSLHFSIDISETETSLGRGLKKEKMKPLIVKVKEPNVIKKPPRDALAQRNYALNAISATAKEITSKLPEPDQVPLINKGVVFIVSNNYIKQIDPETGAAIGDSIYVGNGGGQDGLAYDGEYLYYVWYNSSISVIDPSNGSLVRTISNSVPVGIDGLGVSKEYLILANYSNNTCYIINKSDGSNVFNWPLGSSYAGGISYGGSTRKTVFVSDVNSGIEERNLEDGSIINSFSAPTSSYGIGYSSGADLLFVGSIGGGLYALDPDDGSTIAVFPTISGAWAVAADEAGYSSVWLQVVTEEETIPASSSLDLEVMFNASNQFGGTYIGQLELSHNDPVATNPYVVPCTLIVDGMRRLVTSPQNYDFGNVWASDTGSTIITLHNAGNEATSISSITSDNGEFFTNAITPLTVPPFDSLHIPVYFAPEDTGVESATLTISSNAEDNPILNVNFLGNGTAPPIIDLNPNHFNVLLQSGDTITKNLTIENTGSDTLKYSISSSGNGISPVALAAYWDFNEGHGDTLYDMSGHNNHGIINGATWYQDSAVGGTLLFDGSSDFVEVPHSPSLDITGKLTIITRVKPSAMPSCCPHIIGKMEKSSSWQGSYWIPINGSSSLRWGLAISTNPGARDHWSSQNITMGEWCYLATTFDDSLDQINLYLNGALVSSFSESFDLASNNLDVLIGTNNDHTNMQFFKGQIDEILIYNRILSDEEILSQFNEEITWLTLDPIQGAIISGNSEIINCHFSTKDLFGGTYFDSLKVFHNAPGNINPTTIPVELNVNGYRRIAVSPQSYDFGNVWASDTGSTIITLHNAGNEATSISSITSDNGEFFTNAITPLTVPPFDSVSIMVFFAPTSIGQESAIVTISSNAEDNPELEVTVVGQGTPPPKIVVSPSQVVHTLAAGDSIVDTITIFNNGGDTLVYDITAQHSLSLNLNTIDILAWVPYTDMVGEYVNTVNAIDQYTENHTITNSVTFHPDSLRNQLVDKEVFLVMEQESSSIPSGTGTAFKEVLEEFLDGGGTILCLCPGLGNSVAFLSESNLMQLTYHTTSFGGELGIVDSSHALLKDVTFPFFALNATTYCTVNDSSTVLATYSGSMVIAEKKLSRGRVITLGVDFYDKSDNWARVISNAIQSSTTAPAWLSVSQATGHIVPGSAAKVPTTLNSKGLFGGHYAGLLDVTHNDPAQNNITILCTLHVDGHRKLSVLPETFDFGNVWVGLQDTTTITLFNEGNEATSVSSITSDKGEFFIDVPFPLTVLPFNSIEVPVYFAPEDTGLESAILTIISNAEDNPELLVNLLGRGVSSPRISVDPLQIIKKVPIDGIAQDNLIITNIGGDDLQFELLGSSEAPIVINEFCNNPDFIEIWNRGADQDLTGWAITIVDNTSSSGTFTFPTGFVLEKGKRVVVRENTGSANDSTFYYGINIGWVENSVVALSLINDQGRGVDFVKTVNSAEVPPSGTEWHGSGITFSTFSAARNQNSDHDDLSDWTNTSSPTEYFLNPGQDESGIWPSWLLASNTEGVIKPTASDTIALTFNAAGLQEGLYEGRVILTHNAPEIEPFEIFLQMNVGDIQPGISQVRYVGPSASSRSQGSFYTMEEIIIGSPTSGVAKGSKYIIKLK